MQKFCQNYGLPYTIILAPFGLFMVLVIVKIVNSKAQAVLKISQTFQMDSKHARNMINRQTFIQLCNTPLLYLDDHNLKFNNWFGQTSRYLTGVAVKVLFHILFLCFIRLKIGLI